MSDPEPQSVQLFEHSYYIGNYMSGILYGRRMSSLRRLVELIGARLWPVGINLVVYFRILQQLTPSLRQTVDRKHWLLALYSTVLIALLTIDISANAVWGEQMWITFRNRPGGVVAFLSAETSVWYETLGSTAVVAILFLGDAFLVCAQFYHSSLLANSTRYCLKALSAVPYIRVALHSNRGATPRLLSRVW